MQNNDNRMFTRARGEVNQTIDTSAMAQDSDCFHGRWRLQGRRRITPYRIVCLHVRRRRRGGFFQGAQFVHFLLGPATVALGVPIYTHLGSVRRLFVPMMAAVVAGSVTAILSSVGIAWLAGADLLTLKSLASKSVTTPIAMAVTQQIGGLPSLTAVFVILTGIIGAVVVTPLFNALGVRDKQARGFAAGVAAHGIGTARAFQVSDVSGAFAGIAMALNGIMTALLLPLLAKFRF